MSLLPELLASAAPTTLIPAPLSVPATRHVLSVWPVDTELDSTAQGSRGDRLRGPPQPREGQGPAGGPQENP